MTKMTRRVEELAARRGWGTSQLANVAGLDPKTVRNILTGRTTRVDLATIARLANALGVEPGALWRSDPGPRAAWDATAGIAGRGTDEALAEVVAGRWSERTDPALERATRSS
ncbi:MAG: helix-turn-helix domain-containing protein [Acidimicrobiales bacterium]